MLTLAIFGLAVGAVLLSIWWACLDE